MFTWGEYELIQNIHPAYNGGISSEQVVPWINQSPERKKRFATLYIKLGEFINTSTTKEIKENINVTVDDIDIFINRLDIAVGILKEKNKE